MVYLMYAFLFFTLFLVCGFYICSKELPQYMVMEIYDDTEDSQDQR